MAPPTPPMRRGDSAPRRLPRFASREPVRLRHRAHLLGACAVLALILSPGVRLTAQPMPPAPEPTVAPAPAQSPELATPPAAGGATQRNGPVTFTADAVDFDQNTNVVTATGSVEAWQGDRILRADRFTYDRNSGVATATGNVQMLQADGQVLFADRAELQGGLRDGVVEGISGYLLQNGRIVANGARRSDEGRILDLSRIVYSACNLCATDPTAPLAWQLQARTATRDLNDLRMRYSDASLLMAGVPVFYTPYLSHPDPSVPRQSGFLSPTLGSTTLLGAFVETPYYWAIDGQSDLTLSPLLSVQQDPNLGLEYRHRFNAGTLEASGSIGNLNGTDSNGQTGLAGHIFSKGRFSYDDVWRYGFDLNRASSDQYLRTFRYGSRQTLTSTAFTEGFWGTEAYARIEGRAYQGLRSVDDVAQIPVVLPNVYYEQFLPVDSWGGRLSYDAGGYAVFRDRGTSARRLASRLSYEVPTFGSYGDQVTYRLQGDGVGYSAERLDLAPNYYAGADDSSGATGNLRGAIDWRLPMVRSAGEYGRQLIEPRVQLVSGPAQGAQRKISNEDSQDFEFTDTNLFDLNRFSGRDRQEGGNRVDAAFRSAWYFPNGGQLEGLIGRSFRDRTDAVFAEGSGLEGRSSDYVARTRLQPVPWLELLARARLDKDTFESRATEVGASVSFGTTTVYGGYLFAPPNERISPVQERTEVSAGVSGRVTENWRANVFGRYDLKEDRGVSYGVSATYEDECLILDARFVRSFAETARTGQPEAGNTLLLFRIGLKTVGDFGFRAM